MTRGMKLEDVLLPPNDMELEKLWISMCYSFPETMEKIDKHCFYVEDYNKLYKSMVSTKSKDASVLALDSWVNIDIIYDILMEVISESSIEYICKELIKYKNARTIIRWIQKLENQARWLDIDKSKETLQKIWTLLDDFEEEQTLDKQAMDYMDEIENEEKKLPSWYTDIDKICKFVWWQLVIVAGRPWMWKTTVMLNIALRQSNSFNVWFCSMEMKVNKIIDRIVCILSWLNSYQMDRKKDNVSKIINFLWELLEKKLFITDKVYTLSKLEQYIVKNKLDIVYVDYLGLMQYGDSRMPIIQRITEITRQVKLIALKHNCMIVLWAQLNREASKRIDKRPTMEDLRDSWSIEQDADIILWLYREDYYDKESEKKNILDMLIIKNRDWAVWDIVLWLYLSMFRMIDIINQL